MLDFSKVRAAGKRTRVEFGEAGDLWFRALSVRQRVALFDAFRAKVSNATASDDLEFKLAVIASTACDENGADVMTEANLEALRDAEPALFEQISDAAMRAAGFGAGDRVKPSGETPSAVSPSA